MKARVLILMLVLLFLASAVSSEASGHKKFLSATGQEFLLNVINPGQVTCVGGPCGPGSHMKLRGRIAEFNDVLEGPAGELLTGVVSITMACNLDENMTGPCWGTFELPLSDREVWEGIWYGEFNLATFAGNYTAIGHGHGGRLHGLMMKSDVDYPGDRPYPYGNISAIVLDPHRR